MNINVTRRAFPDLFEKSEAKIHRTRAEAILWIKSAMARHGITIEQLFEAGCFSSAVSDIVIAKSVMYRDAAGNTWDGIGDVPEWLQRATNAGQSIEHFRMP
ncbi:H-NS family nucleoid-associated regulatory protein [Cupriavidus sp. SIMBA_020]|uniref:H-NS family nucleoid-associated regulatory protein n=1 Tax=Cupriavidus sp. SIMBA_020 TaxID=3085766 RepID=UPI00397E8549